MGQDPERLSLIEFMIHLLAGVFEIEYVNDTLAQLSACYSKHFLSLNTLLY
jgi:hypothetical protein